MINGKKSKHQYNQMSGRRRFQPFMDDFETSKPPVEEVTVDVLETARKREVEPEEVTELLQSHDKTLKDEELILLDEQRN